MSDGPTPTSQTHRIGSEDALLSDEPYLAELAAEALGRQPLGDDAYLHVGKPDEEEIVITVVGVPEVGMAGVVSYRRMWSCAGALIPI